MVTLRYLAGGESHKTLSVYFMIGRLTISKIIPKVLKLIIKTKSLHTWGLFSPSSKVPSSENELLEVERRFANRWDYVNTI